VVLVTWASKPEFKQEKIRKIVVSHTAWSHLIDAYTINEDI